MPHAYYKRIVQDSFGFRLGEVGSYGTGIVFTAKSSPSVLAVKHLFDKKTKELGMKVIGWRTIETGIN